MVIQVMIYSVAAHAVALFIWGNIVLWQNITDDDTPQLEAPPSSEPESVPPLKMEVKLLKQIPQRAPSQITVKNAAEIDLPQVNVDIPMPGANVGFGKYGEGGIGLTLPTIDIESVFGSSRAADGKLTGYLYDLKKNPGGEILQKPREGKGLPYSSREHTLAYEKVINEFMSRNWNENVFKNFARSPTPLYGNLFFIPSMSASEAPKSFGLENEMEPAMWVAYYHGEMVPAVSGRFRLVGKADDMLIVRINRRVVFDGGYHTFATVEEGEMDVNGRWRLGGLTKNPVAGEWFSLEKGRKVDVEVLLGEIPGGKFGSVLLYQQYGVEYPMKNGVPVLPVFSTSPLSESQIELVESKGNGLIDVDGSLVAQPEELSE